MINERDVKRITRFFIIWWAATALLSLGAAATIAYVIYHFVSKAW